MGRVYSRNRLQRPLIGLRSGPSPWPLRAPTAPAPAAANKHQIQFRAAVGAPVEGFARLRAQDAQHVFERQALPRRAELWVGLEFRSRTLTR